ncbi:hypothetical protein CO660_05345 [Rhizobium sp. L9]|uniref:phosphotransferase n=1 Tax=Rhizobium sp. L9 TaxID=1340738 RepID=UPI000BEA213D|nr:phosphotransferase [Rhizobium sp. L9]PDT30771.1 hypothetical protein CO660_05345 [Rhizobium sp. L9]
MNHSQTSLIGKVQGTLLTPDRPSEWGVLVLGGWSLALRWFGGDAARLIRRNHDATEGLVASPAGQSVELEVVCHNDLSPCNFVFRSGRPVAVIDFDSASPGLRMHDLGYAAWMWLDLGDEDIEPDLQRRG